MGAINARIVPQVEYGIDPRGWNIFRGLINRHVKGIQGLGDEGTVVHGAKDDPSTTFYGALKVQLQPAVGLAALGKANKIVDRSTELVEQRGGNPLSNAPFRIFAERMERRR